MRLDAARRFALSVPETTEEPHFEKSSFRVRGKIFATVPEGGGRIHVHVDPDERLALIAEDPSAFEETGRGSRVATDWVHVVLARADAAQVRELLEQAWRLRAPLRVVAAYDADHAP